MLNVRLEFDAKRLIQISSHLKNRFLRASVMYITRCLKFYFTRASLIFVPYSSYTCTNHLLRIWI